MLAGKFLIEVNSIIILYHCIVMNRTPDFAQKRNSYKEMLLRRGMWSLCVCNFLYTNEPSKFACTVKCHIQNVSFPFVLSLRNLASRLINADQKEKILVVLLY
jgi:hypothetical protein